MSQAGKRNSLREGGVGADTWLCPSLDVAKSAQRLLRQLPQLEDAGVRLEGHQDQQCWAVYNINPLLDGPTLAGWPDALLTLTLLPCRSLEC